MAVEVWGWSERQPLTLDLQSGSREIDVCAQLPVSIHPVMVQNTVTASSPPQLNFSWKASPLRHIQGFEAGNED